MVLIEPLSGSPDEVDTTIRPLLKDYLEWIAERFDVDLDIRIPDPEESAWIRHAKGADSWCRPPLQVCVGCRDPPGTTYLSRSCAWLTDASTSSVIAFAFRLVSSLTVSFLKVSTNSTVRSR